ncbi:MAG: exo-alpha-sialidase [Candidatus Dormibacteraeota bacterium]|nr:exo-alpha-sialidase [Candidatus Dormibacteraeota bacterium]
MTVTGTEGTASHQATVSLTVTGTGPPGLVQLSSDPFTDPNAEHATQVEPDTLSNGSTMVSVFQVGRFNNGGADAIGFATTTNGGASWTQGLLPGLTTVQGGSPNLGWARVSDPAVAYDPKAGLWIAESLTINSSVTALGVAVNTSPDGVTWSPAVQAITSTGDDFDKSWIVCDTTPASSHYGNCYIEFDDNTQSNLLRMITSTNGGATWSAARGTSDNAHGLGGQPLVQPNGTVIVPYFADSASQMRAFVSTNGGSSWNSSRAISSVSDHAAAGGLRTEPLPSAEIDSSGRVYVVWQDCRFRSGCTSNDIVMSKSSNGTSWSSVTRVPIDATTSGADHFIPGLAVDRSTSGSSAHLGLYYYYYPVASCTSCQLDVGFISSTNGGTSWGTATQVAGPMTLSELAPTTQGPMVGDYISASFMAGKAWSVFAVGQPASGSTLNEAMYTLPGGLAAPGGTHTPGSGGGQAHTRSHSATAF